MEAQCKEQRAKGMKKKQENATDKPEHANRLVTQSYSVQSNMKTQEEIRI